MSNAMIREVENKIIRAVVTKALVHGYSVSVFDGEEFVIKGATDYREVKKAMFSSDEDRLYFSKDNGRTNVGWVLFIYGNSGWDVISDYTTNMEHIMADAQAISDRYAD